MTTIAQTLSPPQAPRSPTASTAIHCSHTKQLVTFRDIRDRSCPYSRDVSADLAGKAQASVWPRVALPPGQGPTTLRHTSTAHSCQVGDSSQLAATKWALKGLIPTLRDATDSRRPVRHPHPLGATKVHLHLAMLAVGIPNGSADVGFGFPKALGHKLRLDSACTKSTLTAKC